MGRSRNPDARPPGTAQSVSVRMDSELWHRIDLAARAAGHSFSHEVDQRLRASFAVDDSLVGPSGQVIKHLIGAWGTDTDPADPATYLGAMLRVIEAMMSRFPDPGGMSLASWNTLAEVIRMRVAAISDSASLFGAWRGPWGENKE